MQYIGSKSKGLSSKDKSDLKFIDLFFFLKIPLKMLFVLHFY